MPQSWFCGPLTPLSFMPVANVICRFLQLLCPCTPIQLKPSLIFLIFLTSLLRPLFNVCVCEFVCVWAFVCVSVTCVRRPNYKTMCVGADFRTAFGFGFTIKHLISQSPLSPTATLLLSYYLSLFLFIVPLSVPFCLPVRVCVCVSVTSFDCPLTSEVCLSSTRCLHFPISRGLILLAFAGGDGDGGD